MSGAALLLALLGLGDPWAGAGATADTLEPGELAVRLPIGRSSVGVAQGTEVWVVPADLWIQGTRVGVERTLGTLGPVTLSVAPSIGEKWSLGRTWLQLEAIATSSYRDHRLSLIVAPDVGVLRQARLGDRKTHDWSVDRLHLPVKLVHDWRWPNSIVRTTAQLMLYDEGEIATYGVLTASWLHRWSWLYIELGAGMLLGRPTEHTFLGRYERVLWMAYPNVDLWIEF